MVALLLVAQVEEGLRARFDVLKRELDAARELHGTVDKRLRETMLASAVAAAQGPGPRQANTAARPHSPQHTSRGRTGQRGNPPLGGAALFGTGLTARDPSRTWQDGATVAGGLVRCDRGA